MSAAMALAVNPSMGESSRMKISTSSTPHLVYSAWPTRDR
jgi:hypothetical protein